MFERVLKLSLASGLLIVAQACTNNAPTPDTISTSIAQTMAVLTQTPQPGIPITGGDTSTATLTALPTTNSSPIPAFTRRSLHLCNYADTNTIAHRTRGQLDTISTGQALNSLPYLFFVIARSVASR